MHASKVVVLLSKITTCLKLLPGNNPLFSKVYVPVPKVSKGLCTYVGMYVCAYICMW